jgi:L,D-peptidoglycan transpeptidase YkuD (ErfK/YbiS/YcfS/YnhG family)
MPEAVLLKVKGHTLQCHQQIFPCAAGKSGFTNDKKEGDGCTPVGRFLLRECWYRADRLSTPETELPLRRIEPHDGWCDDPRSPDYNRHVLRPYVFSHECLWRDNHAYDLIIPLGYNDDPVISGKGSAIFMHVAQQNFDATEGCIALNKNDLLAVLTQVDTNAWIEIHES